jgi:hypothetical protein
MLSVRRVHYVCILFIDKAGQLTVYTGIEYIFVSYGGRSRALSALLLPKCLAHFFTQPLNDLKNGAQVCVRVCACVYACVFLSVSVEPPTHLVYDAYVCICLHIFRYEKGMS